MEQEDNSKILKDEYTKKIFSDPSMEKYAKKIVSLVTDISLEELESHFKMVPPDDSILKQTTNEESDLHYLSDDTYINVKIDFK